MNKKLDIYLAGPRGFCAGVDRAIDIVNQALKKFGPPIYVRHEVVHNKTVVDELKSKGVIFVDELSEVPQSSHVIFSAHGVSKKVETETNIRGLQFHDATCPLVTKVHMEVIKHARAKRDIILIGHEGHPEVEGTMGRHIKSKNSKKALSLARNQKPKNWSTRHRSQQIRLSRRLDGGCRRSTRALGRRCRRLGKLYDGVRLRRRVLPECLSRGGGAI